MENEGSIVYNGQVLYKPHPKQAEFHVCPARYTLIAGGLGGAKSTALCMEVYQHCIEYPGAVCFLGRKRYTNFEISTRLIWNKMIPRELYKDNQQKHEMTILTGKKYNSTIYYGGFDMTEDVDKFKSTEFSCIAVDQAEEITAQEYANSAGTRLRQKIKQEDGSIIVPRYRGIFSANPRKCFLRDIFVERPDKDHVMITSNAEDNPSLPPNYVEELIKTFEITHMKPEVIRALIYGSWDLDESECAIIQYSKAKMASQNRTARAYTDKRIVSCDVAREGDDLTVIYGWEGSKIVDQDIYGKKDLDFTAARMVKMQLKIYANTLIWDADGIGGGLKAAGLKVLPPKDTCLIEYHGSGGSDDERYGNQRTQAHFEAGELFGMDVMSIPDDSELIGQLVAPKFEYRGGKLWVQDKKIIKKEAGKSPDKGDSAIIGIYGLKRAPSTNERKPIGKGTFAEAMIELDEYKQSMGRDDEIGNHSVKYW